MVPAVSDPEALSAVAEQVPAGGLIGDQCGLYLRLDGVQ